MQSSYSVHYTVGGIGGHMFSSTSFCGSPFEAVLQAITKAGEAGFLTMGQLTQAHAAVQAAEALFCGTPQPTPAGPVLACATCGESADFFGECGCAYVTVPQSVARYA